MHSVQCIHQAKSLRLDGGGGGHHQEEEFNPCVCYTYRVVAFVGSYSILVLFFSYNSYIVGQDEEVWYFARSHSRSVNALSVMQAIFVCLRIIATIAVIGHDQDHCHLIGIIFIYIIQKR